jgi:hypothetical protein
MGYGLYGLDVCNLEPCLAKAISAAGTGAIGMNFGFTLEIHTRLSGPQYLVLNSIPLPYPL